ncbi:MAG: hypothetical protein A2583_14475 [Bdellovibrionales bacterium RIFOXYD1_FULL_53_11]|nr:MAG: hypothetical protein A2583_14475 [Bdellovibrionales bacterium RIFOXYD1_FULL_53_11]
MKLRLVIWLAALFVVCGVAAAAAPPVIELDAGAAKAYNIKIRQLFTDKQPNPPYILKFPDGASYEVKRLIDSGGTTFILKTMVDGGPAALRIPLGAHKVPYINITLDGYERMSETAKQGAVRLLPGRSMRGQYIAVEYVDVKLNLADYLKQFRQKSKQEIAQYLSSRGIGASMEELESALGRMLSRFNEFKYVGDFRAEQVGYDGVRWVLLDWSENHIKWRGEVLRAFSENARKHLWLVSDLMWYVSGVFVNNRYITQIPSLVPDNENAIKALVEFLTRSTDRAIEDAAADLLLRVVSRTTSPETARMLVRNLVPAFADMQRGGFAEDQVRELMRRFPALAGPAPVMCPEAVKQVVVRP